MEGFTILDGIVAIVIILSAILAYSRGFVREGLSIGGWIGAVILGYLFADEIKPMLESAPVVGDFLDGQCEIALLASFAIVMVIGLVIFSIFTPLFSGMVQRSILGGLDQGIGFLFGVARGVLLVAIALIAYDFVVTTDSYEIVDNSATARIFETMQLRLEEQVPNDVPGLLQGYFNEFTASCNA